MSSVALLATLVVIGVLLLLDRQKDVRTSPFLWLPVIWLSIIGSRPLSVWLAGPAAGGGMSVEVALDGNSTDAAAFGALLALGLLVLFSRRRQAGALIASNPALVIYFVYCLVSVSWSPFPNVAFKRWTKAVGDLVMVLVVLTDLQPIEAIRRLFARVGAILMPLSIYLTRYTVTGRGFDPDGRPMNTGVTTNKNSLGLLAFVIGLSVIWSLWSLLRTKEEPNRGRRLLARIGLLVFVMSVLWMAGSATSVVCVALGSALIIVTSLGVIKSRPAVVHVAMVTFAIAGGLAMGFGGKEAVLGALGRDSNLTGRTEIWSTVMSRAQNPIIGTGFESFWNASIKTFQTEGEYMFRNINSAHNGYIDVYLNLGWLGVSLVVLVLLSGYFKACRAVHRKPEVGGLLLAFVVTAAFYSVTEAGFRMLSPNWFCLLLAVVAGSGAVGEIVRDDVPELPRPRTGLTSQPRPVQPFGGSLPNAWNRSRP
jgi:exopolysaccharide production protein ExoQ